MISFSKIVMSLVIFFKLDLGLLLISVIIYNSNFNVFRNLFRLFIELKK